jgi:TP901 family phage tail tape measure protein
MKEIEARVKITATDKSGATLSKFGAKLSDVNRRAMALNRQQSVMQRSFTGLNAALLRFAAPAALAYGIKQSVTEFADVERRMTRIGITADATKEQMSAATQQVRMLANQSGVTFDTAVSGLETLTSSGQTLDQAMAFLPAILKTASASGADVNDIANSALKSASAFNLSAGQMQLALDKMDFSGKLGQFELRDMSQYIPKLANQFSTLGYTGMDGLSRLAALMQTVRADTGTSEAAADDLLNVFQKMGSTQTISAFKKMGVSLTKEMDKAKAHGEDTVDAFTRLTVQALKGDLGKLPLLFQDSQVQQGMISLIKHLKTYHDNLRAINSESVNGTVERDLAKIMQNTQAKIDHLDNSWKAFLTNFGAGASNTVSPILDKYNATFDENNAYAAGLDKLGPDEALNANQRQEFDKRFREAGLDTEGPQSADRGYRAAVAALGMGSINDLFDWISQESLRKDTKGKLRHDLALYRPGRGPANPLRVEPPDLLSAVDAKGNPIAGPYGQVPAFSFRPSADEVERLKNAAKTARLADRYAEAGLFGRDMIPDSTAKLNAMRSDFGRDAIFDAHQPTMAELGKRFREQSVPPGDLPGAQGPSIIDAVLKKLEDLLSPAAAQGAEKTTSMKDGMDQLSALTENFDKSGQSLAQSGDEAGRAFLTAVQQAAAALMNAAEQAARTIANAKPVAVPGQVPTVNANLGHTNGFVREPGTGHR